MLTRSRPDTIDDQIAEVVMRWRFRRHHLAVVSEAVLVSPYLPVPAFHFLGDGLRDAADPYKADWFRSSARPRDYVKGDGRSRRNGRGAAGANRTSMA